MKYTFKITGMTYNNCVAFVTKTLLKLEGVGCVHINLERAEADIAMTSHISISIFKATIAEAAFIENFIMLIMVISMLTIQFI